MDTLDLHTDQTNICFYTMEAEDGGWDPVKLAEAPLPNPHTSPNSSLLTASMGMWIWLYQFLSSLSYFVCFCCHTVAGYVLPIRYSHFDLID